MVPADFLIGSSVAITVQEFDVDGVLTGVPVCLTVKSGNCERSVASIDVSNPCTGGTFKVVRPGQKSATGTLELCYETEEHVPPPYIEAGNMMQLVIDSAANPTAQEGPIITMPILVTKVNTQWSHGGDYSWSISYESTGPWTVVNPTP